MNHFKTGLIVSAAAVCSLVSLGVRAGITTISYDETNERFKWKLEWNKDTANMRAVGPANAALWDPTVAIYSGLGHTSEQLLTFTGQHTSIVHDGTNGDDIDDPEGFLFEPDRFQIVDPQGNNTINNVFPAFPLRAGRAPLRELFQEDVKHLTDAGVHSDLFRLTYKRRQPGDDITFIMTGRHVGEAPSVPAPGALGLLGVAGFIGRRCRRRTLRSDV